ncbi:MAG: Ig-like domain-containing protein [Brevefilum sp.]
MKWRQGYTTYLLIALAALLAAFGLLRLRNRVGHLAVYPGLAEQISMYGRLGVTFNQPMNTASAEAHFTVQPAVQGDFVWEGRTLWFTPRQPLDPTQVYQVTVSPGAEAANSRRLHTPIIWQASVREPDILFLRLDTTGGDLWRYEFASGLATPMTDTDASIIDFAPSPTGDLVAYAQHNAAGGHDLWLVDRDGTNPRLLLDCAQDRCFQPDWSVDAQWLAFARESYDAETERYLSARVWTVNTASGESAPLYRQPEAYGHSPSFSPDGKRLATYNTLQQAIRILELETSQESAIPTLYPGVGDWSPNGEELIFIDLVPSVLEPNVAIYIVNFQSQEVRPALGEFIPNMDYDPPQWSPDGIWIAYGARPADADVRKGIWVKNLAADEAYPVTDDRSATFVGYRWDPWGERLVFQRFSISGPSSQASLWLWERSTGKTTLLIENGARPEWLP